MQELAKEVDITQHGESEQGFVISIGGTVLVQGTKVNKLKTVVDAMAISRWAGSGTAHP